MRADEGDKAGRDGAEHGAGPEASVDATLDITREVCPMTYVRTKLKLESLEAGALLEIILKGTEPLKNVPRNASEEGHVVVSLDARPDGTHRLVLRKQGR
ncbi:sulfurtransferase TusA family protein [Myxococcus stipitatus]|uniref:sulfurtransferase TusA family protein n=1 Tax=Myxococcus stipitatus TaxID=83455 RepID=UPI001F19157C|nr:sulfurtransferase TusA family protein [Myxococcus stipitatus]MCE9670301.1 sulfurtransferase TusA family protein [Myxococcus stipitatus]